MKSFAVGIFLALALTSCAHSIDCSHPELAAAKKGVVLECSWKRARDGHKVRSCLVMKPTGIATISYQGCPVP